MKEPSYVPPARGLCLTCLRAPLTCYCAELKPCDPGITFVILIHGREAQKRIATGRLAHLALKNSLLLPGYDYSEHEKVNALIADPANHCVVLYPGEGAVNLSAAPAAANRTTFPAGKRPVIFVIDGTWITARKTMQRSANLAPLPRICFDPSRLSRFRVRKQPADYCFSTVEAIHETIELLAAPAWVATRAHDALLRVFDHMVEQQLVLSSRPKLYCLWKAPPRS